MTPNQQVVRILLGVVLAMSCGCLKSQPPTVTLQPMAMNPTGRYWPNPDGVVCFFSDGSLKSQVHTERGSTTITFRASGDPFATPTVHLGLGGHEVGKLGITSKKPEDYSFVVKTDSAGTQLLEISITNAWGCIGRVTLKPAG